VLPYEPVPLIDASPYEEAWSAHTDEVLSAAAAALGSQPHEVRGIGSGSPARALADLAADEAADMIVIGSTERGPLGRVYPGTTATALLAAVGCPIAVAPRGFADHVPTHVRTIGVGYREEYADSHPALAQAQELAKLLGAELRVIASGGGGPEAAQALGKEAAGLDLLVLGSRHFSAPAAAVVSSVSSRLAAAPPCPLVVVPGPALVLAG
jgi:nucleotide-binding universal stress UspA family protein